MEKPKSRAQMRREEQERTKGQQVFFKGFDCSTPEKTEAFVHYLLETISAGKIAKDELDINIEVLEYIYSLGYAFYQEGRYEKAYPVFHLISLLDHQNPKYLFSLGAVCHMQKDYMQAMQAYMVSFLCDGEDPTPLLRFAECAFKMGLDNEAKTALQQAIDLASSDTQFKELKQRAEAMLKS